MIYFNQNGVACFHLNTLPQSFRISHKQIITHNLDALTNPFCEVNKPLPVIFIQRIFNRHDRILITKGCPHINHPSRIKFPPFPLQIIAAVLKKLRCCSIQSQDHIITQMITCCLNRTGNDFNRFMRCVNCRSKATFIPHSDRQSLL